MRGFEDLPVDWAPASVWVDDEGVRQQTLEFMVPGTPVPKGSVIKGRYGGYHDTAKGIDEWVASVSWAAKAAMRGRYRTSKGLQVGDIASLYGVPPHLIAQPHVLAPFLSAVMVDVTFVLPRPKSTPKRKTPPAIKKPDSDKLVRAVLDACTKIVYNDDAQVVEIHARKRLADVGETPGAVIMVTSNVRVQ